MGAMFRSEAMALCQLFLQPESAYPVISELGELGIVQFKDANADVSLIQRKFVTEVRRCDELERKLRYIETEIKKEDMKIPEAHIIPKAPNPREMSELEIRLKKIEREICEISTNSVNLKVDYTSLLELRQILEKADVFFQNQDDSDLQSKLLAEDGNLNPGHLGFVAGIMKRERVLAFETMLWRISRGNVFVRRVDLEKPIEDPNTGHDIHKTVFVAFYQGEQLKSRIMKVCAGFRATIHHCPSNPAERQNLLKEVRTRIEDLNIILNQSKDHRQRVLFGATKDLHAWIVMVKKMKAIYHTLNYFNVDVTGKCLIGECWAPVADLQKVQKILADSSAASGSAIRSFINVIHTNDMPPTYNRSNKFTRGFQNLIDAYGMGSYREVNPALYTIITFPFLFAVMFGDIGHGVIVLLFGAYLCIAEEKIIAKKIKNEVFNIFFGGRYIILLMGGFAIYTGFIYNDIFSKSLNIFGSSWGVSANESFHLAQLSGEQLNPSSDYSGEPYPFGIDPAWQLGENKIIFLNSFKMKLSIIFGVIHMMFGVCLGVVNHMHFRNISSIFLEFIPQLLFLTCLFFYMVVMILFKWVAFAPDKPPPYSPGCAPSVLILFINMMLFDKHYDPPKGCNEYMFDGQEPLQIVLVIVAVVCIPVLLLGKPIAIMCTRKRPKRIVTSSNGNLNGVELEPMEKQMLEHSKSSSHQDHHAEESIGDAFIHQAIHTIEYILSTVSHTASYLRLWALSLAHAQLSEVVWNMVLSFGMKGPDYVGAVILYFIFAAWAALTLAILVTMEGLSAFLHTLRLHWVEFMSKFFQGLGYPFEPFNFKSLLAEETDDSEE